MKLWKLLLVLSGIALLATLTLVAIVSLVIKLVWTSL